MKRWRILVNSVIYDIRIIKEGFNWTAWFFSFFWLIYQRLYFYAFFYGIIIFLSSNIKLFLVKSTSNLNLQVSYIAIYWDILLCIWITIGFQGGKWAIKNWIKKGYEDKGVILAPNKERALYEYLKFLKENNSQEYLKYLKKFKKIFVIK